jgi:hypothetical protein
MEERPNSSAVNDWLIVDPDANISPSQLTKAKEYMKIDKLNQNKWEKPKLLLTKQTNVNSSEKNKVNSLFSPKSNNEKDNRLFGRESDKSNTFNLSRDMTERRRPQYDKNSRENLSRTNLFNDNFDSRGKNNERTLKSGTFNESSRKNWVMSKNPESFVYKTMEPRDKSSRLKYSSKHLNNRKKLQPRLLQTDQHQKEIDLKPENKIDLVSALTELKAIQEINVEDEYDLSAFRARKKFSKKDKVAETSENRKPKSLKKLQEEEEDFNLDYRIDTPKKKNQTHQAEQSLQREIFISDAISVSNLAKMIGIHLGEQLTC